MKILKLLVIFTLLAEVCFADGIDPVPKGGFPPGYNPPPIPLTERKTDLQIDWFRIEQFMQNLQNEQRFNNLEMKQRELEFNQRLLQHRNR